MGCILIESTPAKCTVRIEGTLILVERITILDNQFTPLADQYLDGTNNFIFQQDEFGPRRAKSVLS